MIIAKEGVLTHSAIFEGLQNSLSGKFTNQKVLVLIPDHTRSVPMPEMFHMVVNILEDVKQLDFMVALGTHPAIPQAALLQLVGISSVERDTTFKQIGLFNHIWDDPTGLASLGTMEQDEIKQIAGKYWHPSLPDQVDIRINRLALQYDQILIIGPTFPHEVAGFSGGAKYLFPGISGPEMINATHWLGALAGVVGTIGVKQTPVRAMIHAAIRRLRTPVTLVALVVDGHDIAGMVIGDILQAWNEAADLSASRHIHWVQKPYQRVLSCAPPMYDELWTAAKAMYKLEPAMAVGGEVVIYAPHLKTISQSHGQFIYEIGYHILPYFLKNWDDYKHIPLGVLAHSTHMRGSGIMENDIEKPNLKVTLASKISPEDCAHLNLGYLDPEKIEINSWKNREDEGLLFVPRAGEILYRLNPAFKE